ncbi:hypothetical protein PG985_003951 [Apiospora marii]|uniref:uncharacterized protein n=1 Tax=Apiospora marii TaxID=335849 RepID=UPI00312E7AD9
MQSHHLFSEAESRFGPDNQFQFISIQNPQESRNREIRRRARSHAIRQSWQTKRRTKGNTSEDAPPEQREQGMRMGTPQQVAHPNVSVLAPIAVSPPIITDPFEAGPPLHGTRFRTLLGNFAAIQATEPVFSVRDSVVFQTFHSVFRTGLEDAALLNAVMLTFAFAALGGASLDQESLRYQSKAISSLRGKISSVQDVSALEAMPTIGAILLLAGVENRQDLNSSVLTGSSRLFSHTSMAEMQWTRDVVSYQDWFTLPPGFQRLAHLFPRDFVDVMEDVHTLQHMRDSPSFICQDTIAMLHVDNHQAWACSRLQQLLAQPEGTSSALVDCCYCAVYLSSTMLCCKVWRKSPIPTHLSAQLIRRLQNTEDDVAWDRHSALLTWMLFLGGAFASTDPVRDGYVELLHQRFSAANTSWEDLLSILRQYIWSEKAFEPAVKTFYDEVARA